MHALVLGILCVICVRGKHDVPALPAYSILCSYKHALTFTHTHARARAHTHRYTVKDLLNHEFFAEGVKVEVIQQPENHNQIKMRMEVPSKEVKKNGHESIEFAYNLMIDEPEDVVGEMVSVCVCVAACACGREVFDILRRQKLTYICTYMYSRPCGCVKLCVPLL